FSSRRRHTSSKRDWSSDVCSSDLDDVPCMLGDYVAPQPEGSALSIAQALHRALPQASVETADWSRPADLAGDAAGAAAGAGHGAVDLSRADAVVMVVGGTSHRSYHDQFAAHGAIAG